MRLKNDVLIKNEECFYCKTFEKSAMIFLNASQKRHKQKKQLKQNINKIGNIHKTRPGIQRCSKKIYHSYKRREYILYVGYKKLVRDPLSFCNVNIRRTCSHPVVI